MLVSCVTLYIIVEAMVIRASHKRMNQSPVGFVNPATPDLKSHMRTLEVLRNTVHVPVRKLRKRTKNMAITKIKKSTHRNNSAVCHVVIPSIYLLQVGSKPLE
jgi:hypothetical protein